jgi:FkbM family methyltransferase
MKSIYNINPVIVVCVSAVGSASLLSASPAASAASSNECPLHHCKQGYHHRFDHAEKWVKKFDNPARDKWQKPDAVIAALNIAPTDKIADIGAGTGYFSLRIAKTYPTATVYAADVEPSMVEYLKKQAKNKSLPNHKAVKVAARKADLPAKVNLVLIVDTYHHIDNRIAYFEALKKQLLPDARVAIIDFTAESPEGPPPEHRMSKAEVQDEMKQAGFSLDQDTVLLPYQYFLTFTPATN